MVDGIYALVLNSPVAAALWAVGAVLALSLVGPPWIKVVGRDAHTPSLVDRWKLFSWLHPVKSAILRWVIALTLGALVCIPIVKMAQQSDLSALMWQAVQSAYRRIWKAG